METGKITRQLCAATLGSKSKQRAAQISAAILVGFIALTSAPVRSEKACDAVSKAGLEEALGHILGKGVQVPLAVSDAVADYLTNPDDKKFSAAMNALANGAVGIAVPGAGWAFVGGKLVFAGVDYTIEEAKALQLDAFLCEAGGLIDVSFFQFPGVQRLANGIDCRNFTEKIKTIDDFVKLETQFKIYKTYVLGLGPIKLGGKENVDSYSEILDNEWKIITTTWKIKVGAALIEKLSADLIREAEAFKAKQSCTAGGTGGTTTTGGDKEPQMTVGAAQLIWGME